MIDSSTNPYRPPSGADASKSPPKPGTLIYSFAGTAMVLAIALTIWVLAVTLFDRLVPRQFDMLLWSATLLTSLAISAFVMARTVRFRPRLLHVCFGAIAAIAAYAWLEGSAPGAGESLHATLFYTSAIATPIVLVGVTALTPIAGRKVPDGG